MAADEEYGPIETKTRKAVADLGSLEGFQAALAELAYALAQRIDAGATGMAMSANARELRDTIKAMTEAADVSDATAELLRQLAAPVVSSEVRDSAAS